MSAPHDLPGREEIEAALRGHQADYLELRLETGESTRLIYRGRELEDIGKSSSRGGCARALVRGAWGFISFNDLHDLREKVTLAARQASLVGREESQLAPVPAAVADVPARVVKDPAGVPLTEKKRLLDEYNEIIWATPKVQTSNITYSEGRRQVVFASSGGSYIQQGRLDLSARIAVVARDGSEVQQAGVSIGSHGDYSFIQGLHQEVKGLAQRAVDMLAAPHLSGGEHTLICDPVLAGVFVHEAFGHLSESDFVYENQQMKEIMALGRRFGGKHLNIVDGAALPNLRGSYKYDDEGVPAQKTYLIREGILVGRLHSRETAAKMGEKPTGNARAINYHFPPIVRMTNTIIEPGEAKLEDMLAGVKDGVYAKNWYGGMTSMEMFTFSAGEAYRIRNGKIAELLRPVVLTGNVFTTMEHIDAIGNDLDVNEGGGCGKNMQMPLPVSNGSPHIRIRQCLIGGKAQ